MHLKVKDQLHVSSVSPNTLAKGTVFEVSDDIGKTLVDRGLAEPHVEAKAEPVPQNKAEKPPANKAVKRTARPRRGK